MIYIVPSLAPILKSSLAISTTQIGEIVGVSWIGVVTTSMILGTYGDRIGVGKVLFVAHIIQGGSLFLLSLRAALSRESSSHFLEWEWDTAPSPHLQAR
jgi:predicted MFS family arabinose efflux permease